MLKRTLLKTGEGVVEGSQLDESVIRDIGSPEINFKVKRRQLLTVSGSQVRLYIIHKLFTADFSFNNSMFF